MLKLKNFIILAILAYFTTYYFFLTPNILSATSNYFEDNFEDPIFTSDNWDTIGNGGWTVNNGKYTISLNPGLSNSVPKESMWDTNWTNIRYELDLLGVTGVDKNVLVKFVDPSNFLEFHANDQGIILEKGSNITGGQVLDQDPMILQNGINYHIKIDIFNNNNIKVYIDDVLVLEGVENTPLTNWRVGLRAGSGGFGSVNVQFDNVVISELPTTTPSPSPSPIPSPSASPTVSPSPFPTIGPLELPINYEGRLGNNPQGFINKFWSNVTAFFDHVFTVGIFKSFTGDEYNSCTIPLSCYDSHNGTDFAKSLTDGFAYSATAGKVVHTSKPEDNCNLQSTGYGCSVIIKHTGNLYGLYAHLNSILVEENQIVSNTTIIGEIGKTGSATGEHLHFAILKPITDKLTESTTTFMKNSDWKKLLTQVSNSSKLSKFKPYCTYTVTNNLSFAFQDPSGWFGSEKDPWGLPRSKDGCGINSPYLWKYNVIN